MLTDRVITSSRYMNEIVDRIPETINEQPFASLYGMPVIASPLFPYSLPCDRCNGTGEGETATFCSKCKGAGEIRIEGMIESHPKFILITSSLPRKFDPSFPTGLVTPPTMKGLP